MLHLIAWIIVIWTILVGIAALREVGFMLFALLGWLCSIGAIIWAFNEVFK